MMTRCTNARCTRRATHVRMVNSIATVFCLDCAWAIDRDEAIRMNEFVKSIEDGTIGVE